MIRPESIPNRCKLASLNLPACSVVRPPQEENSFVDNAHDLSNQVDGWCIGAGLDLISAADVRLCTRDAKISLREAAIGIVADLGSINRMPSIVGDSNARMMALTVGLRLGLGFRVSGTIDGPHGRSPFGFRV
jgi:hypothetical protein